MNYYYKK